MIAFYAMGGGLGHLTRIHAFIRTQPITGLIKVITSNPSALKFFSKEEVIFIAAEVTTTRNELGEKIKAAVTDTLFDHLYIDTFPCGILGELDTALIRYHEKHYLARRLVWNNYKEKITKIGNFTNTYRFEPLETDHQQFINSHCTSIIDASLNFFSNTPNRMVFTYHLTQPIWLIVHTTHQEELKLLIDHAQDIADIEQVKPHFIILSDVSIPLPGGAKLLRHENPLDWYPHAAKIFTAAGFNTWYQLKPWRDKHIAVPFKRRFDDQFWRVSRR